MEQTLPAVKGPLNGGVRRKFGLVAFEESGMPWTLIRGRFPLLDKAVHEEFGEEPHWQIESAPGVICYVPESCVVVLEEDA